MGILSPSVSITRYKVDGKFEGPVMECVTNGFKQHVVSDVEDELSEKRVGWTSFDQPYTPNFEGSSFVYGSTFVFALRIDKKSIPSKIVQKYYAVEMKKKLKSSGRPYLTKDEKKMLKDHVLSTLRLRIPATPHVYDVVWPYEKGELWFFTNLKSANEELETLFVSSFNLPLIRLFPFTAAQFNSGLPDDRLDVLAKLSPSSFRE